MQESGPSRTVLDEADSSEEEEEDEALEATPESGMPAELMCLPLLKPARTGGPDEVCSLLMFLPLLDTCSL